MEFRIQWNQIHFMLFLKGLKPLIQVNIKENIFFLCQLA